MKITLTPRRNVMITKEMIKKVVEKVITENQKECINIKTHINKNLTIFNSKFGGIPYLPKDFDVPCDSSSNQEQFALLAQINCTELPENNLYPKVGIVQFWIGRDDLMGLEDDYKVVYFENIDNTITKEEVLTKYKPLDPNNYDQYTPFDPTNAEFGLTFEKGISTITVTDYRFEDTVINAIHELYPDEEVSNLYCDLGADVHEYLYTSVKELNHAIGGYPNFTQYDPRGYNSEEGEQSPYDIMLLQVESEWKKDNDVEIIWGDCGVGNFFISEENLKNRNFEDVLYNWDCS